MHPIERLRYVARSHGAPPEVLARESATALGAFRDDPAGMLAACRRILARQPTCGPLWWLCARMLCAADPMVEARLAVGELEGDPTGASLAASLPDDASVAVVGWPGQSSAALRRRGDIEVLLVDVAGESYDAVEQLGRLDVEAMAVPARGVAAAVDSADLVLIESLAAGPDAALVPAGSRAAAVIARDLGTDVWLVAGAGRLLPRAMFDALVRSWEACTDLLAAEEETLALGLTDLVAGVGGVVTLEEAVRYTDCPVTPELFSLAGLRRVLSGGWSAKQVRQGQAR